jgi:hypothetical protein
LRVVLELQDQSVSGWANAFRAIHQPVAASTSIRVRAFLCRAFDQARVAWLGNEAASGKRSRAFVTTTVRHWVAATQIGDQAVDEAPPCLGWAENLGGVGFRYITVEALHAAAVREHFATLRVVRCVAKLRGAPNP